MRFTEQAKYISEKCLNRLGALQRLMPDIDGQNMLYGVVQSILLYQILFGIILALGK